MIYADRYHDISCGHRVYGHESKCAHLHGHNYRFHFEINGKLDKVGRVLDFSVIKTLLCQWLEDNWDHRFLVWDNDPLKNYLIELDPKGVVSVPVNPTAENLAEYFATVVGPEQLKGTGVHLTEVRVDETRKCAASWRK